MSDRWLDYFHNHGMLDKGWLEQAVHHWQFNQHLFGYIRRFVDPPARIMDIGSGPGFSDLYLASCGYRVTGVDNDARIVEYAKRFSKQMGVEVRFETADAFNLSAHYGQYDLVYSNGVLEHFDRDGTIRLLQEQACCAPRVLIVIPTKYTAFTDTMTDERIYSIEELRKIVEDSGLFVETSFGYGDICATQFQIWLRRLIPHGFYRWLQNHGFAYAICVLGRRV